MKNLTLSIQFLCYININRLNHKDVIDLDFSGKTAVITGAANGIGKGIALHYSMKGANIVVADIDEKAGAETVSLIKEQE